MTNNMANLNSWPILSFIPAELAVNVRKAFVFGGAGNEALIVLVNGDVYALGFNGNGCLGVGNGSSTLEPKKIDELCQKEVVNFAYGMGPHVLAVTGKFIMTYSTERTLHYDRRLQLTNLEQGHH